MSVETEAEVEYSQVMKSTAASYKHSGRSVGVSRRIIFEEASERMEHLSETKPSIE